MATYRRERPPILKKKLQNYQSLEKEKHQIRWNVSVKKDMGLSWLKEEDVKDQNKW